MKTFKKNQKVVCLVHGPGKVTNILSDGTVGVKFVGSTESYTPTGKLKSNGSISSFTVLFDAKAKIVTDVDAASPKETLVTVELKKNFRNFIGISFIDWRSITSYLHISQHEADNFIKENPEAKIIPSIDVGRH